MCHVEQMRRWIVVLIAVAACAENPVEEPQCIELFPSECAQQSSCTVVEGFVVAGDVGSECIDYTGDTVGVGCDAQGRECLAVETIAAAPDDPEACFLFTDSCIPDGWLACDDLSEVPPEC